MKVTYAKSEWSRFEAWEHLRQQVIPGCPQRQIEINGKNIWSLGWTKCHTVTEWVWDYSASPQHNPTYAPGMMFIIEANSALQLLERVFDQRQYTQELPYRFDTSGCYVDVGSAGLILGGLPVLQTRLFMLSSSALT